MSNHGEKCSYGEEEGALVVVWLHAVGGAVGGAISMSGHGGE